MKCLESVGCCPGRAQSLRDCRAAGQVVWDLMSGEPRALIEIKELEHAKNLRYDVTRDGGRVVVWCTDSVPFPNLVVVDVMSQNKISVYCHEGLVRQVGQQAGAGGDRGSHHILWYCRVPPPAAC